MPESFIVQQPSAQAEKLIVLFHGVGGNSNDMVPLGQLLANELPDAFVVSVGSPNLSDLGAGREWFSVRGITEENRVERVEAAMPAFMAAVRHWQEAAGVGIEATTLVGFSQGAIMALESTRGRETPAGRIISIAGRFAVLPEQAPAGTRFGFLHGRNDMVISYQHAEAAAERLTSLGADVNLDIISDLGHGINAALASALYRQLKS
jgi:phospholipase/carboxylesterase